MTDLKGKWVDAEKMFEWANRNHPRPGSYENASLYASDVENYLEDNATSTFSREFVSRVANKMFWQGATRDVHLSETGIDRSLTIEAEIDRMIEKETK